MPPIVLSVEGRKFIPAPTLFVIATAFGISSTVQAYWMARLELHPQMMQHAIARLLVLNMGEERPPNFPGWRNYTLLSYLTQLDWLLMTYLFLIGLAYALAYRRESEASALNTSQLETRLVEAQLQSLQRQLHPHFLFNTLNTIAGLIRTDPDG